MEVAGRGADGSSSPSWRADRWSAVDLMKGNLDKSPPPPPPPEVFLLCADADDAAPDGAEDDGVAEGSADAGRPWLSERGAV